VAVLAGWLSTAHGKQRWGLISLKAEEAWRV